ncbi:hypothetical protein [Actinomadura xylanilytica]|uniref:hypothetical protein n=1 Tax=Actinomadura xylanilytica TaxID=887459 RepID=UPI00255B1B30|nr:hypothetical protein [Actinomadura xylanilytica]MDL4776178.1 hypothetical protein [Actinomadura xylanilytica]
MKILQMVQDLVDDASLDVPETSERITELLAARTGRGLADAVEILMETADERTASYASTHLALMPGAHAEKTRVAERLRGAGPLARDAGVLVPWLPGGLLDAFVADSLSEPVRGTPLASVVFEIAAYQPARLRPFADRFEEDGAIRAGLLSGAPDALVDGLVERWRSGEDGTLESIALVRTDHAVRTLISLREELEKIEGEAAWETFATLAGLLPDTLEPAGYRPAFMGLVVDRGESAHVMGGGFPGEVPACGTCRAPAERVLTLAARLLPFGLSADPSFFLLACGCGEPDVPMARIGLDGAVEEVLGGPSAPAAQGRVVPGARALALEPHPNQDGVSMMALGGHSNHHVGGLPRETEHELRYPACAACGTCMRYVTSIDGGFTPFGRMGLRGTVHGFWCDDCRVSVMR